MCEPALKGGREIVFTLRFDFGTPGTPGLPPLQGRVAFPVDTWG